MSPPPAKKFRHDREAWCDACNNQNDDDDVPPCGFNMEYDYLALRRMVKKQNAIMRSLTRKVKKWGKPIVPATTVVAGGATESVAECQGPSNSRSAGALVSVCNLSLVVRVSLWVRPSL